MDDLNINTADGLIEATIKVKQETYYLVTEDNLNSLKHRSLLNDLFVLLASLLGSIFFSFDNSKIKCCEFDTSKTF